MANQTVYPFGTGGSLPSSVGIINDLTTGGVDKALSAEQGKVIGEELYGSGRFPIDLSSLTEYGIYIATATNLWGRSDTTGVVFVPVNPGEKYQVIANAQKGTGYCVLQNSSHTINTTPSYATGYSSLVAVNADSSSEIFTIPEDGHYVLLWTKSDNTSRGASIYKISEQIVIPGLVERVNEIEDDTSRLKDEVEGVGMIAVDFSSYVKYNQYIAINTGVWTNSVSVDVVFILVNPGDTVRITAPSLGTPYALLQTDAHTEGTTAQFCSGYEHGITVNSGETVDITIPNDGHYIAVWTKLSSGNTTPNFYRIVGEAEGGLLDKVSELEDYKDAIAFFPAGVADNLIDYIKSIQIKTKVLTIREQEMAPTSGVHITAYEGRLYCTINGIKYEINMTQINNE